MPDHPPAAPVSSGNSGAEEALIRLATDIGGYGTLPDLLDHLAAHLRPLFPFDAVGIVLHDPATNEIRLARSSGTPENFSLPADARPVHYGPAGWVFQSQKPRYDLLTAENTHPTLTLLYKAGFRSASWLPLSTSRARLGVFVVVRRTADAISPDYDQIMTWVANVVALAIEHLAQVEALERLQHQVADERDRARGAMYDLGERVKELTALHRTARLLEDDQLGVPELLRQIAALLPPAFQYPDVTEARVYYGHVDLRTPGFTETPWTLTRLFETSDGAKGGLDVVYLQDRPPSAEGPFLREERHLIDSLADMLTAALDKRTADTALRESEDHVRSARDRARLLLEITNAVISELDLRRLLNAVSQLLKEKIPHHFASIGLWDEQEERLRRHALVHTSNHSLVEEGRLVGVGSPGDLAFRRGETTVFEWDDILALGEPTVSVMAVEGLRSVCCVPLKTARGSYGVLNVGKPADGDSFAPDDVELLEDVGRQLAVAFENALSFRQAERYRLESLAQRDRLQLLLDVNNQLLAQPESHAKRLSVLSMARPFVGHDYAALIVWNADANELCVEANTYYDARGVMEPHRVLPLGRAPSGVAFAEQRIRTFTGAELGQFDPDSVKGLVEEGIQSMCCVPLTTQRGTLGTLSVGRRSSDGFTASEVSLLGDVAGQVAIAVANTLAYQEISALKDRLTEEKLYLEDEISSQHDFTQIVGTSHALTSVLRQIRTVGPTDATVLLLGETGTGKELLARALHDASKRRAKTFVRVNGAALPVSLIESELFGYEKGAFTGATMSQGRALRAGAPRYAVPRRGGRDSARRAAQAAARAAGAGVRAAREHADPEGRRAADRGHQPQPRPDGGRRHFPQRPLLSPQRLPDLRAAAARAARRHRAARAPLRAEVRAGDRTRRSRPSRPRRWTRCRNGPGRATSASWKTSSSARSSCRRAPRCRCPPARFRARSRRHALRRRLRPRRPPWPPQRTAGHQTFRTTTGSAR